MSLSPSGDFFISHNDFLKHRYTKLRLGMRDAKGGSPVRRSTGCGRAGCGRRQAGAIQLEQLVLIVTVAIGFAAAAVTLGPLLLAYHEGIELVLSLPIP